MNGKLDVVGLFPSFEAGGFGGVQGSGREAWRNITSRAGLRAEAFQYVPGTSRLAALWKATGMRAEVDTLLVWHLGLLKLAPFVAASRRRTVVFLHGIEAWRKQDSFTSLLMRRADLFLSNSEHTWSRFVASHPGCARAAHRVVHLGLGEPLTGAVSRPDPVPAALMVGRLSKDEDYKGHRELIQAWPRVLACVPGAELWIVGGGDLRPELERLAVEVGVSGRVIFFGAVPDEKRDELLRRCRALVMPSSGEGFGLVYVEAMRMSRPCLVSVGSAGAEVVQPPEAGLAVELRDSGQVAESVVRLLGEGPEWEEMASRARVRYEANFTARHFGQRLQAALFDE